MQDGGRPSRFAFQRPRQSGSEFIWGWPPFAGVRTALRRRGEEQECCAPPGVRGWLLSDCCFHTRTAWKSARTGFICLFILLVLLKLRYTFYVYGKSKNSSQQLLKKKSTKRFHCFEGLCTDVVTAATCEVQMSSKKRGRDIYDIFMH